MIHACTKTRFEQSVKEHFDKDESGIVMVMMARYTIDAVKKMLSENYEYWHLSSGKTLDIYLAGYGAYLPSENANRDNKPVEGTNLFFNNRAFKTFKDALYSDLGLKYDDRIELFLLNYTDGKVQYVNALRIDIGASTEGNQEEIRKLMAFIIRESQSCSDVQSLAKRYNLRRAKKIGKSAFKIVVIEGIKIVFKLFVQ